MNTTFMTYKEENEALRQKIAEQADRIKELESLYINASHGKKENLRELLLANKLCAEQAAVIEKLMDTLEKLACLGNGDKHGNSTGNLIAIAALAIPTNNKQILAEWVDKVLQQGMCGKATRAENRELQAILRTARQGGKAGV